MVVRGGATSAPSAPARLSERYRANAALARCPPPQLGWEGPSARNSRPPPRPSRWIPTTDSKATPTHSQCRLPTNQGVEGWDRQAGGVAVWPDRAGGRCKEIA